MKSNNFIFPVKVYIEDTDYGGVVFHANYLKYFERARSELALQAGFGRKWQSEQNIFFLVRHMTIDFLKPAQLEDSLEVISEVISVKKASFIYAQSLRLQSAPDSILCKANVKIACVNRNKQACALPESFEEFLMLNLIGEVT